MRLSSTWRAANCKNLQSLSSSIAATQESSIQASILLLKYNTRDFAALPKSREDDFDCDASTSGQSSVSSIEGVAVQCSFIYV